MAQDEARSLLQRLTTALRAVQMRVFNRNTLGIWIICSALAAFSGPFGTYHNHDFLSALLVWLVLLGCAIVTAFLVFEICNALAPGRSDFEINIVFLISGSIAITIVIDVLLTYWLDRTAQQRPGLLELWVYTMSIMLIVVIVRRMLPSFESAMGESGAAHIPHSTPAGLPPHSRLARRLDIPQDVRIIHISADGHFVEVQTCSQSHRLRMRFSDAVAELDETVGLTVHRSHWVHRDAIRGWVPDAAKPFVVLNNDVRIPVSKTYFAKVEAAGLATLDDTFT